MQHTHTTPQTQLKDVLRHVREFVDPEREYLTDSDIHSITERSSWLLHRALERAIIVLYSVAKERNDAALRLYARRKLYFLRAYHYSHMLQRTEAKTAQNTEVPLKG